MKPLNKILCPIDCSPGSMAALDYALSIAHHFKAELHVLHSWHITYHVRPDLTVWLETHGQQPIATHVANQARAETDEFLGKLDPAVRSTLKVHVVEGEPASVIAETAAREKFDLVVMGTHGRTGLAHLALGSVAEKVVRHSACPVLTVRHPK